MGSRPERVDGHIGIAMGGSLMERRRVSEEGREVVKLFSGGGIRGAGNGPLMTVARE